MIGILKRVFGKGKTDPAEAEVGPVHMAVNLDQLDDADTTAFHEQATKHAGIPMFVGHVEHGYSKSHVGRTSTCPRCHAGTQQRYGNFIYATQITTRVMFAPAGFFCTKYPTVVVDEEVIKLGIGDRKLRYEGVLGLDYDGRKDPDAFRTWNGQETTFILGDGDGCVGMTTRGSRRASAQKDPQELEGQRRKLRRKLKARKKIRKR
ncbi:hypothetical protein H8D79_00940 [PVC group bacterium]|nr:hypothetical protein [PVC group bacterium]